MRTKNTICILTIAVALAGIQQAGPSDTALSPILSKLQRMPYKRF